jgi:hypothetical protein
MWHASKGNPFHAAMTSSAGCGVTIARIAAARSLLRDHCRTHGFGDCPKDLPDPIASTDPTHRTKVSPLNVTPALNSDKLPVDNIARIIQSASVNGHTKRKSSTCDLRGDTSRWPSRTTRRKWISDNGCTRAFMIASRAASKDEPVSGPALIVVSLAIAAVGGVLTASSDKGPKGPIPTIKNCNQA